MRFVRIVRIESKEVAVFSAPWKLQPAAGLQSRLFNNCDRCGNSQRLDCFSWNGCFFLWGVVLPCAARRFPRRCAWPETNGSCDAIAASGMKDPLARGLLDSVNCSLNRRAAADRLWRKAAGVRPGEQSVLGDMKPDSDGRRIFAAGLEIRYCASRNRM